MTSGWSNELWADALAEELGEVVVPRAWWDLPAVGQLTITRPEILDPFAEYNRRHPEHAIGPGNFVSVAYPKIFARPDPSRLIAPFVSPREALDAEWFEVYSGEAVRITTRDLRGEIVPGLIPVKSYADVARRHVARPERKFEVPDGGPCLGATRGKLARRRVLAVRFERLGKEGGWLDRRTEGDDVADEVQLVYVDPDDFRRYVIPVLRLMPRAETAVAARISERALRRALAGGNCRGMTRTRLTEIAGVWASERLGVLGLAALDACAAVAIRS